ncbi:MAG: pseudouridine synthase [Anaerolineales bacterium]
MPDERLQKVLARAGIGSRRACEVIIDAGRVQVNNITSKLGDKINPERDLIVIDGKTLKIKNNFIYIALNKPRGVLSTVKSNDPRPNVRDLVDLPDRFYPVGRLDVDSEGLILLTNDGELTNFLTHPRYGHEKEYRVLVVRRPDKEQLGLWRRGVVLEDGYRTKPAKVRVESNAGSAVWLRVIMREGHKRQIRRVGAIIGLPVEKIIRIRIGSLKLGGLMKREWRYLDKGEVYALKREAGIRSSNAEHFRE